MRLSPRELLAHARDLLQRAEPATAGIWPRACALLARQALEATLDDLWAVRAPGLERCSAHAQLLCLTQHLSETGDLPARARYAWTGLSRACHQHPYELPPTVGELNGWMDVVGELQREVARVGVAAGERRPGDRPSAGKRELPRR